MKLPFLTLSLAALVAAAFIMVPAGADAAYGFSAAVFEKLYLVLTSLFLHADAAHLLSNMLALLFFGAALESEVSRKTYLALFVTGAAAGDFLFLLVYPQGTTAVGASAAIFALIGAATLIRPFDLSLPAPVPLAFLGIMYAAYNVHGLVATPHEGIAYAAHFGGLFIGLAYGFRRMRWKKQRAYKYLPGDN